MVCAGVFLLTVGEKADLSKNIPRCGHMCQLKLGCSALSRQPGRVFCEVQGLAVWNYLYLNLAFGSARARAPCEGVVSTLFGRARTDLERSNHTTKSLRIIFSRHK